MAEQENRNITLVDENGNETLFEVLDTFTNDENGKSYVFISEVGAEEDENGYVEIHAYSYVEDETGEGGDIFPIETEEEWAFVESKMEEIEDQINALEDEDEE
ncbi:DUF1292 domain-containing protein [Caryophanon tenue]|uniref:UPF0473 protein A6M13_01185 n=1 Tax=Caryophanon tenue TaxID=33978 RepID=A0A1C0YMU6_9BACL|nr:DUF1292 domain-containing protein [Caryophanon tenue]OCS88490.1 hypothetical protein A6M13_01185 [Caryophanon tenue]